MKSFFLIAAIIFCTLNIFCQQNPNLEKLVATEQAFAQTARENGTKEAFLEFLADDAVIFQPGAVNGKEFWRARSVSPSLLSWTPVFADISSNAMLGYTTGNWDYRPKGKTDAPVSFGQFMTIWRRQPDGNYKAVLDLGISHEKPTEHAETTWQISAEAATAESSNNFVSNETPASNSSNLFFDTAATKGLGKAYKMFASTNIRLLRGGKFPILGKINALAEYKKDRRTVSFGKNMTLQSAGDLAYSLTTYEMKITGKTVEKGNTVQIWKFIDGKWLIVMDIFSPISDK